MGTYDFEDLAGFISNYFREEIIIDGEPKNVQRVVSSQELIRYTEYHLKFSRLGLEERSILANLIEDEKCQVRSVKKLLKDIRSVLK